jgi:cyclic pyranopterin phosphate synthase
MPPEGVDWQPHENILRFEEIVDFVRVAASQGIRQVRLTGGEPLVRPGMIDLVQMLSEIPEIEDLSLTTNGILLEKMALPLKKAGLKRVNVSLDTLKPEKYQRVCRGGALDAVLSGLAAAEDAGFDPVKINMVVMRGVNDDELMDFARLTIQHPWHVRFIELMPIENQQDWGEGFPQPGSAYISTSEIKEIIHADGLTPVENLRGNGPARSFQLPGAMATIGFISPIGQHFCSECNRLRLTADGNLRLCLLNDIEIPIRDAMRGGRPILDILEEAMQSKPEGHSLAKKINAQNRKMAQIGG